MESQADLTRRILYHKSTKTAECPGIRRLYDAGIYQGIAIPLKCERCLYHIASREDTSFDPWKWPIEHVMLDPCNRDIRAILKKEKGFDYVLNIFTQLFRWNMTGPILRRLHLSLIHRGITMEFLLQCIGTFSLDPNYPLIEFVEDASGVHVEWSLWIEEESAREKKEYREFMRPYKEELLEVSWHPSRFRQWCLDTEEYTEVGREFGAREGPVGRATSFLSVP